MEWILIGGIGLGLTSIIAAVFIRSQRQTEAAHVAREELAAQKGWTHARTAAGKGGRWTLTGSVPGGPEWTMFARKYRSGDNTTEETRWTMAVPPPDGVVAVGPPLPDIPFLNLGGAVVQMLLKVFFGEDAKELVGIEKMEIGPPNFRGHYAVASNNRSLAESFLSGPAEMALLEWASAARGAPIVLYWRRGLEIRITRVVEDPEDLTAIVDLGLLLHTTV